MSKYTENKKHYPRLYPDNKISAEMLKNQALMKRVFEILQMAHESKVGMSQLGNVIEMLGNEGISLRFGNEVVSPVRYFNSHFWELKDIEDSKADKSKMIVLS